MNEVPLCSIVIPTRSRPRQLLECLESIAGLNYERNRFEVVVVDDGGEPPVGPIVGRFEGRLNLTVLRQVCQGPAAARNAGASAASGHVLAFTDDDCRPERDWLRILAGHLAAFPDHMAGGRTINALREEPYSVASQTIVDVMYAYYNADPHASRFFASNNLAVCADRFRAVGGFDTSFRKAAAEDRELCDRWLQSGRPMTYLPDARVLHAHHLTFASFLRQHFQYGRGAFRYLEAKVSRGDNTFDHPLGFYRGLLAAPLAERPWWRGFRGALLLAASQVGTLAGFAREKFLAGGGASEGPSGPAEVVERCVSASDPEV